MVSMGIYGWSMVDSVKNPTTKCFFPFRNACVRVMRFNCLRSKHRTGLGRGLGSKFRWNSVALGLEMTTAARWCSYFPKWWQKCDKTFKVAELETPYFPAGIIHGEKKSTDCEAEKLFPNHLRFTDQPWKGCLAMVYRCTAQVPKIETLVLYWKNDCFIILSFYIVLPAL